MQLEIFTKYRTMDFMSKDEFITLDGQGLREKVTRVVRRYVEEIRRESLVMGSKRKLYSF